MNGNIKKSEAIEVYFLTVDNNFEIEEFSMFNNINGIPTTYIFNSNMLDESMLEFIENSPKGSRIIINEIKNRNLDGIIYNLDQSVFLSVI
tara:strand:- start:1515 stop:1787 length:273 start_codon:yes stop_codon:yes gene_type:complete